MRQPETIRPACFAARWRAAVGAVRNRFAAIVDTVFADREILLRSDGRVRFVRLGRRLQMGIAAGVALLGGWFAYSTATQIHFEHILAAKNDELGSMRRAFRTLQSEAASVETRFAAITQGLEAKHAYLLDVLEQNGTLRERLSRTRGQLDSAETERSRAAAARDVLHSQVRRLEEALQAAAQERRALLADLARKDQELQQQHAERARTLQERNRLHARTGELEKRLAELQAAQQQVLDRLAARTKGNIAEARDIIAMTGLDADRLLARLDGRGVGGPFVAVPAGKSAARERGKGGEARAPAAPGDAAALASLNTQIDRWDDLQLILRRLPLAAPADNYTVMSAFGPRRDPFNNEWAMHNGIDLRGPARSPIYSAGPGTVSFVGHNGSYGLSVDIDHGMGIVTRYGHLSSAQVRKGQTVSARQQIGTMGSTGRASGVHLHYEVMVSGTPLDPMKFMKAGRYVLKN